eukprot:3617949-Pleurochrysis_carterae.AAC.1
MPYAWHDESSAWQKCSAFCLLFSLRVFAITAESSLPTYVPTRLAVCLAICVSNYLCNCFDQFHKLPWYIHRNMRTCRTARLSSIVSCMRIRLLKHQGTGRLARRLTG